jgi:hypothetical protein
VGNLSKSNIYFFNFINIWLKNSISFFFFFNQDSRNLIQKNNFYSKIQKVNCIQFKLFKLKYRFLSNSRFFFFLDYIYIKIFSFVFKLNQNFNFSNIIKLRFNQTNLNYYDSTEKSSFNKTFSYFFSFFSGFRYFWLLFRFWVLGLILGLFAFYFLTYIRLLPFNKVIFEWFLIAMFVYWLLSGFVYFIKKYQYSKYTSVVQRFWKRSFILFWVLETFLFLIYFYLTLNATEEPVYMYDQMKLYKSHLFSWRLFILKLIPIITMIVLSYYLQLSLKWSVFNKQSITILAITLLMLYTVWLEFYQFFHIVNFYGNLNWVFDYDEFLWNLELEFRRTRLSNNYTALCLMAKFWHLIFIFIFWVFFVLRINEINRVRYPLLAANAQNLIILYILSWLYMYPWFKFVFRNFLDSSFYWFMTNNRSLAIRVFFTDFKIFVNILIFDLFSIFSNSYNYFSQLSFFYWHESSLELGFNQFKKHALRDFLISSFN